MIQKTVDRMKACDGYSLFICEMLTSFINIGRDPKANVFREAKKERKTTAM